MEGQQNVQLPPGTTEWNHSYYTGSSFSAPHSVQQLQNGTISTSVQPLAYTQEANGAASSGFESSPPLPCSTISSQVPVCPTRNVTGDVMPLAEAITQLSQTTWSSPSNIHKQLYNSLADTPTEGAILTGAHLMQPSSGAYEAEDRCIRVSVARIAAPGGPQRHRRCTVLPQ